MPYLGVLALIHHFGAKTWFGLWPTISFVAIFLGMTLASLATRWTPLADAVTGIGRRTLPIYVMHVPILALIHLAVVGPLGQTGASVLLAALALAGVCKRGGTVLPVWT